MHGLKGPHRQPGDLARIESQRRIWVARPCRLRECAEVGWVVVGKVVQVVRVVAPLRAAATARVSVHASDTFNGSNSQ